MPKKKVKETEKKVSKSMRTAFIRISARNETKQGIVEYSYNDIISIVKDWRKSKQFKYYIKDHENETSSDDPRDLKRHFHVLIVFQSPSSFDDVKKRFPYGDIETARNVKDCVQYLVHMNDDSKRSYDFDEIISNDSDIDRFRTLSKTKQNNEVDLVLQRIASGEIREYNLTEYVSVETFAANKTRILNGLEYYRRKVMTNKDRQLQVMIFTGDTGTYKTTYAKQYALNTHKSICISSSSNDPMQDYKGEDILLLDDLRDDAFKFHDFLKILDNHTSSSMASRYSNKQFIGDTIIITSSQPLDYWYQEVKREDKEQLYRRIPVQMQFTKDTIKCFSYNEKTHRYEFDGSLPNVANFKPRETKKLVLDIAKSMGLQLTEEKIKEFMDAPIGDEDKTIGEQMSFDDDLPF